MSRSRRRTRSVEGRLSRFVQHLDPQTTAADSRPLSLQEVAKSFLSSPASVAAAAVLAAYVAYDYYYNTDETDAERKYKAEQEARADGTAAADNNLHAPAHGSEGEATATAV